MLQFLGPERAIRRKFASKSIKFNELICLELPVEEASSSSLSANSPIIYTPKSLNGVV